MNHWLAPLALGPDPEQLLVDLQGAATIVLIALIFAETGLRVGFFLPGDSLLFTAGSSHPGIRLDNHT